MFEFATDLLDSFFLVCLLCCAESTSKGKLATSYHWTLEEDKQLLQWVQEHGAKDWRLLAEKLPGRDRMQCRQRWHYHVNPDINHGPWSEDEDKILMDNHKELGSKWCEYRTLLPGRTHKAIRDRWNSKSFQRKLVRKVAKRSQRASGVVSRSTSRGNPSLHFGAFGGPIVGGWRRLQSLRQIYAKISH